MDAPAAAKGESYEAVSPLGEPVVRRSPMAPRLETLEGKRIGEIWNGGFRGDESFPIIERLLRERYPTVTFVPYPEFSLTTIASLHPEQKAATLARVRAELAAKGCDAVITGNGA